MSPDAEQTVNQMAQDSRNIAPRRSPFTQPAQAISASHQRRIQPFCSSYSNVGVRCKTQPEPVKQLTKGDVKTPKAKPFGARAPDDFAPTASKTKRKTPGPSRQPPPGISTPAAHDSGGCRPRGELRF